MRQRRDRLGTGALSRLDERGFAVLPGVLAESTCRELTAGYGDDRLFRARIEMSPLCSFLCQQKRG